MRVHVERQIGAVIVAGLPGQLIPPSILLVLYAGIAEVPVGKALLGSRAGDTPAVETPGGSYTYTIVNVE